MEGLITEKKYTKYETKGVTDSEFLTIERALQLEEGLMIRVEGIFESFTKHPSVIEALYLLEEDSRSSFKRAYHNIEHTKDVMRKTILFALTEREHLSDEDLTEELKKHVVAAAWHDTGIPEKAHSAKKDLTEEELAIELFKASKSYGDFSEEEQKDIVEMIICTKIFDSKGNVVYPDTLKEKGYMLDADLSNFGEKSFFAKSKALAEETNVDLRDITKRRVFFSKVTELLEKHRWHTDGAQKLRWGQRERNRHHLQRLIVFIDDTEKFLREFNKLVEL
jgi:hypothetical protein